MSSSSSSSSPTRLSPEELRRRRLRALDRLDPSSSSSTTQATYQETTSRAAAQSRENDPVSTTTSDIIDLCASSDDDDSVTLTEVRNCENVAKRRKGGDNPPNNNHNNNKFQRRDDASAHVTDPRQAHRGSASSFQVCTYNIWFQVSVHGQARMQAMAQDILRLNNNNKNNPLLFIGFQEVIDPLDRILFAKLSNDYRIVQQPRQQVPYYCAIAVHRSLTVRASGYVPFSCSNMDRGIVFVKAKHQNKVILFTTTHLESYTGKNPATGRVHTGSNERQRQVLEWEDFCLSHADCDVVVMTGDWNWDDERARSQGTDPVLRTHLRHSDWTDVWRDSPKHFNNKNLQFTYDPKVNPMLGGNLRRRFDRILVKNASVSSMQLIGKDALPGGLQWRKTNPFNQTVKSVPVAPSDHFGLVASLKM